MRRQQKLLLSFMAWGLALLHGITVATALTPQEIAQTALGSTVLLVIKRSWGRSSLGSGFVVHDGQIATNYHVIKGIRSGYAKLVGGTTEYAIETILAVDKERDLAIVKVTGIRAPTLPLGDSDAVQIGDIVYVAGNPQGLEGTFSEGIISAIRPEGNNLVQGTILQMTAPISPGSSGGPVLDDSGEVIGVSVGYYEGGQNLNLAIPVNYLKPLIATRVDDLHITEVYDLYSGSLSVDFSPDERYIATGDTDGDVGLWKVSNGENIYYKNLGGEVEGVAFSPGGSQLAADGHDGDNPYVILLEASRGTEVRREGVNASSADARNVRAVAFSPDGRYVAIGVDLPWAWLWEVRGGRRYGWGDTGNSEVNAVAFSPDGRYLATGDDDGEAILLEVNRWWSGSWPGVQRLQLGGNVHAVAFSPDGKYLAADGYDGSNTNVTIYDVSSNTTVWRIDPDIYEIYALAFSPNGEYLAVGGDDERITFYRIGADITKLKVISATGQVNDLAWSPDGNLISDGKKVWQITEVHEELLVQLSVAAIDPVNVGEAFTLEFTVTDVTDLAGWQLGVTFNPAVLQAVSVNEGDFLKKGGGDTFFQSGNIDNTTGKITGVTATFIGTVGISGTGRLLSLTFEAKTSGMGRLALHNVQFITSSAEVIPYEITINPVIVGDGLLAWDVNSDGEVNLVDLIQVSQNFGPVDPAVPRVDVNADGTVNISDLIIVAQHLGESTNPAAPVEKDLRVPLLVRANTRVDSYINPETIQKWIDMAYAADDSSIGFQLGIANLKRLLAAITPAETALLPNYPNPFNPETWIPYHLSNDAEVRLTIYDTKGVPVRQFDLGYQPAGYYTNRSKAAYWDGCNESGESVASGVYFYQLRAGDYTALRRMVILK